MKKTLLLTTTIICVVSIAILLFTTQKNKANITPSSTTSTSQPLQSFKTVSPTIPATNTKYLTIISDTTNGDKQLQTSPKLKYDYVNNYLDISSNYTYNIIGGLSNQLVYRKSNNNTDFLPTGVYGQYLMSKGALNPHTWSDVYSNVINITDITI
jgi:hypothetical protein